MGVIAMNCRIQDLRNKEVVCLHNGAILGCVADVEVDTVCAKVVAIVIYGRLKCFGLLGREDDCVIPWQDIEIIGEDTILVKCHGNFPPPRRRIIPKIFGK